VAADLMDITLVIRYQGTCAMQQFSEPREGDS